eukprot:152807_1
MAIITVERKTHTIISWSVGIVCILLLAVITTYHIKTVHKNDPLRWNKFKTKPSLYASFILIISAFIALFGMIASISASTFPMTLNQCYSILYTAFPTYSIYKSALYAVLVIRIWDCYGQSGT